MLIASGSERPLRSKSSSVFVKNLRVRPAGGADREDLFHIVAVARVGQHAFARVHPIEVSLERVDLAVVRNKAKRVSQVPSREGIGAVTLVDKCQRGDHALVSQVGIIFEDLRREQQTLVNQRLARQRTDVKVFDADIARFAVMHCFDADALADDEQLHSNMSSGVSLPRAINAWRMVGSTSRASLPHEL